MKTKQPKQPNVIQGETEITVDILADAIVKISDGFQKILTSRLNRRVLHQKKSSIVVTGNHPVT
jgi:hypothetical protein